MLRVKKHNNNITDLPWIPGSKILWIFNDFLRKNKNQSFELYQLGIKRLFLVWLSLSDWWVVINYGSWPASWVLENPQLFKKNTLITESVVPAKHVKSKQRQTTERQIQIVLQHGFFPCGSFFFLQKAF